MRRGRSRRFDTSLTKLACEDRSQPRGRLEHPIPLQTDQSTLALGCPEVTTVLYGTACKDKTKQSMQMGPKSHVMQMSPQSPLVLSDITPNSVLNSLFAAAHVSPLPSCPNMGMDYLLIYHLCFCCNCASLLCFLFEHKRTQCLLTEPRI